MSSFQSLTCVGAWRNFASRHGHAWSHVTPFGLLTFLIKAITVLAQRTTAGPFSAIMVLDVISLGAVRVVVMHGFTGANGVPWFCTHSDPFVSVQNSLDAGQAKSR